MASEVTTQNFCVNCRHHLLDASISWCRNPSLPANPVTGEKRQINCATARGSIPTEYVKWCGPYGIWYQPKEGGA